MTKYYNELIYYIQRIVGNKEESLDITQETYARVVQKASQTTIKNERALLYRVAKNVMIDKFRKNKQSKEVLFDEELHINHSENSELKAIQEDQQKHLELEIDNLPKKRRQAFVLHIIEGYSRKEAASMMGISLNAIEKHISRASQEIKENLAKKEGKDSE